MSITTLPDVAEFGGTKADAYAETDSATQLAAAAYNALTGRVIDAFTAIGLDDGSTSGSLRAAIAAIVAGTVDDFQIVSTSSATVTGRYVLVTYSGGTCTLTLTDAAKAKKHTIFKANTSGNTIILARSAGDAASGTINAVTASLTLTQGYYNDFEGARYDVVGQAAGAWWVSSEWMAISDLRSSLITLIGNISTAIGVLQTAVVDATTTVTVASGTRCLVLQNAGATINVTMPDASTTERCLIVKDNSATTQTINIIRSASDAGAAGTINGTAGTYAVTWTSIPGSASRTSFSVVGTAAAAWVVDFGLWVAFAGAYTAIQALQAGTVSSGNIRNLTSGTTATLVAGEQLVRQASANAMALTLPAATVGARIIIVKETTNAGAITLIRAGSDTIHGSASNYVLDGSTYVTSATTYRAEWTVKCLVSGEWTVEANAVALAAAVATATSNISTNTTDITSLKNGVIFNLQVVSSSTATISAGTTHVYIDHAAARTDLTLPATSARFAFTIIKRATTGGFGVRLIPASGSDNIQGVGAGSNFDIGWMTANASTSSARPAAYVTSSAANVVDVA